MTIQNKLLSAKPRVWKSAADLSAQVEITFYLKQTQTNEASKDIMLHPAKRQYLRGTDFEKAFDTKNEGFEILKAFLVQYDLKIVNENKVAQAVSVSGSVEQYSKAFKVVFSMFVTPEGNEHLNYNGVLDIPANLQPYILTISGLDKGLIKGVRSPINKEVTYHETNKGYSPQDISNFYKFPGNDAEGECIGLVELGGDYSMSDIEQYCKEFNLPVPEIIEVGTKPVPAASALSLDNLEVTLDIQMVAGLATKAKIVIYYASSIPEAIHLALYDTANNPSVISCSWAVSENDSSAADIEFMSQMCYQATLQGVSIIAASGDYGAYNSKSYLNVMLPASNPFVLGCGGTLSYISKGYQQVWNSGNGTASGGGYSAIYSLPDYQRAAVEYYQNNFFPYNTGGRGIPDVSANSSPDTAYSIVMKGQLLSIGAGTSASTPVWASLILLLNKNLGYRLGWVNALLYALECSTAFQQISDGNNNYFPAAIGWNASTGLGSPNGIELRNGIKNLIKETTQETNENTVEEASDVKPKAVPKADQNRSESVAKETSDVKTKTIPNAKGIENSKAKPIAKKVTNKGAKRSK